MTENTRDEPLKNKNKKTDQSNDVDVSGDKTLPSSIEKSLNSGQLPNGINEKLLKQLTNVMLVSGTSGSSSGTIEKRTKNDFRFWRTQPVPDLTEEITDNGPIEPDTKHEDIRSQPYTLPEGFYWCEVSLDDENELQELYDLLYENYVEDDDHLFRFDYSKQFLQWILKSPGWHKDWHVGLRVTKSKKLVGFIAAIPCHLQIYDKSKKLVEVNYLCVHKKLRSKRMAPVLIREVTRRVHLRGLFQALFTSGTLLPKPVSKCRYWHRPLNPRKLLECGFSHLTHNMTLQRTIKLYRLPEAPLVKGFRQMTKKDIPKALPLLSQYLEKFSIHPIFTKEEFQHFFMTRDDVVHSYVVEGEDGQITDFCSFYVLPSSVMKSKQHNSLRAAYSFYNVSTVTPWPALIQDMLISAKQLKFDVFNALDLMENKKFLEELKFGIGDGDLHYYLYNWRCPFADPSEVGIVLQ
ncbi:unnamed protein product [Trichobilharzia szidati]|nr:unnamed protein product [Trichobilharzia szidati]